MFVPHWKSVRYGRWQRICESLGIEFVDPCGDSTAVVRRIASAEKVIAESMHAAIIADAFRVPWIPVALSREISPFKWVDWAASLEVPYRPVCLPASNRIELLAQRLAAVERAFQHRPPIPSPAAVAQRPSHAASRTTDASWRISRPSAAASVSAGAGTRASGSRS